MDLEAPAVPLQWDSAESRWADPMSAVATLTPPSGGVPKSALPLEDPAVALSHCQETTSQAGRPNKAPKRNWSRFRG